MVKLSEIFLLCSLIVIVHGNMNQTSKLIDLLSVHKIMIAIGNFLNNKDYYISAVNPNCYSDIREYFTGIKNKNLWALLMYDSLEKFPTAILYGKKIIPAQFFQCVEVAHNNFTGQHCLIEMALKKNSNNTDLRWIFNGGERLIRKQASYGVCIPSSCSAADLKNMLTAFKLNSYINFEVNDVSCTTGKLQEMRTEDWAAVFLILLIFLVTLFSTAYDLLRKKSNKNQNDDDIFISFSLYKNWKHLFKKYPNTMKLNVLHGIRFLSMVWVVFGHYFSYLYHEPLSNALDVLMIVNDKTAIPGTNGYLSVDTFFFLSGLLVCFVFFRDYSKKKSFDVPVAFIHRYLRLTPPFAIMILFHMTIFSRIGSGPIWKAEVNEVEADCRRTWWSDLLYIDNFLNPSKKCLTQTWYLSADMQMFWLSPLILYIMLLLPKFAPAVLLLLIIGSTASSFITSYLNNLPPNSSIRLPSLKADEEAKEYRSFYTRMASWVIGVATGYVICGIHSKKIKLKLTKVRIIVGWLISAALCLGSLYGVAAFLPLGSPHSNFEKSSYRAFHRVGWALGLSWIVIACVSGFGGPINFFLSLDFFQPLAKLSYSIFLVHKSVQQYRSSSAKSLRYVSFSEGMYVYLGDLLLSVIISVPFTLLFEIPFTNIDRYLLRDLEIFPFPKLPKNENQEEKIVKEVPPTMLEPETKINKF